MDIFYFAAFRAAITSRNRGENKPIIPNPDGTISRELAPTDGATETPPNTERKRGTNKPIIFNPDGTISRTKASGKSNTALLAIGGLAAIGGVIAASSGSGKPKSP